MKNILRLPNLGAVENNLFQLAKSGISFNTEAREHEVMIARNMMSNHIDMQDKHYGRSNVTNPIQTNTNESRMLDCIYLRSLDNIQGGHELLGLHTHVVVN